MKSPFDNILKSEKVFKNNQKYNRFQYFYLSNKRYQHSHASYTDQSKRKHLELSID